MPPDAAPVRCRAAKACRRCNVKRVKCDASERGIPCTRCQRSGLSDCALIESRRGQYVRQGRRHTRQRTQADNVHSQAPQTPEDGAHDESPGDMSIQVASISSQEQQQQQHGLAAETPGHNDSTEASSASTYREISWAAMFDQFLEGQQNGEDAVDKCSITYLGESFPLALVLRNLERPAVRHPRPSPLPDTTSTNAHPAYMQPEDIAFLEAKGAFDVPPPAALDALVHVFFERVYPLYPIVNRAEFSRQHRARRVPRMLIHAICFIAATFAPPHVLYRVGFETRRDARHAFYAKAKALFDTGYEASKLVVLQVSLLMSFWGGGPNMYWNFYSWLSHAVTVAETLGCHRSTACSNMTLQDRSLFKRLWWILVVRDTSCSVLVGRPFRINLDHCDTGELAVDDFDDELAGHYQIQLTKLYIILRRIVTARFNPTPKPSTVGINADTESSLSRALEDWRVQVPPSLKWSDDNSSRSSSACRFASTLAITYHHHLILINASHAVRGSGGIRMASGHANLDATTNNSTDSASTNDDMDDNHSHKTHHNSKANRTYHNTNEGEGRTESISQKSAQRIASIACAVVTKSDALVLPHEFFHGIFLAQVVFYSLTKSRQQVVSQLGASGLTNCNMVFNTCRDFWDPAPWIMQLFDRLQRMPGRSSRSGAVRDDAQLHRTPHAQSQGQQRVEMLDHANGTNGFGIAEAPGDRLRHDARLDGDWGLGFAPGVTEDDYTHSTLQSFLEGSSGTVEGEGGMPVATPDMWQSHPMLSNLFDMSLESPTTLTNFPQTVGQLCDLPPEI